MPDIIKKNPKIKLYVAGSYPPQELIEKADNTDTNSTEQTVVSHKNDGFWDF